MTSIHSRRHLDSLLCPESIVALSAPARTLLRTLIELQSFGPRRAITQGALAEHAGLSQRQVQQVNLELLAAGVPICSTCVGQMGQFIATTVEEAAPFRDQLTGRAELIFIHRQKLDQAVRIAADQAAQDRQGQGTLFAETTP